MLDKLDDSDVQSLVFSAHGSLSTMVLAHFRVRDCRLARRAIGALVSSDVLSFGVPRKDRYESTHLLISAAGLDALSVAEKAMNGISREFRQGIARTHRSRALGDVGDNAPANWTWSDSTTHAIVLVYSTDELTCKQSLERLLGSVNNWNAGWEEMESCRRTVRLDDREPFGFRDGLSRVQLDRQTVEESDSSHVSRLPVGEVLIGYPNVLGQNPEVSRIARNSTYLVIRDLEQSVKRFWDFWRNAANGDEELAVWLASKAFGRWPNGMPISGRQPCPEPEFDASIAMGNLSFRRDLQGDDCPLGSHIRRANPRDGMHRDGALSAERSLEIANSHRLMRRGRMYGPACPSKWLPSILQSGPQDRDAGKEEPARGLLFMGLCGDIARQFEFIQQTWLNNPKLNQPFNEVDPIAAGESVPGDDRCFTIPREPIRKRLKGLGRWVTVRGGGYFLLPGKDALRALSQEDGS